MQILPLTATLSTGDYTYHRRKSMDGLLYATQVTSRALLRVQATVLLVHWLLPAILGILVFLAFRVLRRLVSSFFK